MVSVCATGRNWQLVMRLKASAVSVAPEMWPKECNDEGCPRRRTEAGCLVIEPRHLMPIKAELDLNARLPGPLVRPCRHA